MTDPKKILYPTDFSELSLCALPYALHFAKDFNAELHCVHVVDESYQYWMAAGDGITPTVMPLEEIFEASQKRLEDFADEYVRPRADNVTVALLRGKPFVEILRYADEQEIGMIVIATHGHSGLASVFLGSVTEKVVRKAVCPVLTVRHPEHKFQMPTE